MNEEWLAQVIHHLRTIGNDTQQYEVKEAKGALPKSIVETLSAFPTRRAALLSSAFPKKTGLCPSRALMPARCKMPSLLHVKS